MEFFWYIAWLAIISQVIYDLQMLRNYSFTLKKIKKKRGYYRPPTALIAPCKGLDSAFEKNISSFFHQDYDNYILMFIVSDTDDPAYGELCRLKEKLAGTCKAKSVQILVAGKAQSCGQKNHNLLCAYNNLPGNIEIMAFADSDACLDPNWLKNLVHPLRRSKIGVASGYRWFVPEKNNPATLALSVINAKIAQLLGPWRFNQAWGGSMAIHVQLFRKLRFDQLWANAVSDDLTLTRAVREDGKRIVFVPACIVASYAQMDWKNFFSFARRQFLLTRIITPATWWFGLLSSLYSVLGLYGGAIGAVYAQLTQNPYRNLYTAVPLVFFAGHLCRSIMRQHLSLKLLPQDAVAMKAARITDIAAGWLLSPVLLGIIISSSFGRRIRWRGISYNLISPTKTLIETHN